MLRPLLTLPVKTNELSEANLNKLLDPIAESFYQYLDKYTSQGNKSTKHGKMGTIGKVLSRMRSGKTGTSLVGEAARIHEMAATKAKATWKRPLGEGFQDLEQAILELSRIVESSTLSNRNRILSSIDSNVYYLIEKNNAMKVQQLKKKFVSFLKLKYTDDIVSVQKVWQDSSITRWDKIPFPYKKPKNDCMKPDADEFYSSLKDSEYKEENEE